MSGFDFEVNDWVSWLTTVRSELRSHPESIEGPSGASVSIGYLTDPVHGEYAILTAHEPDPNDERTLRPATVEIAPGVIAELRELRVYLS